MPTFSPDPIDVTVGSNLRRFRQVAGISQSALGGALGVTFQQIQKYERGTNRVSASRLQQIADVLNVKVSDFFDGEKAISTHGGALPANDPLVVYLLTAEGRALNRAYWKLSKALRHHIIGLAESLEFSSNAK
ncbi:helix-turn-helix domain-containing protein [Rhizobiales bacterium RZME27]|jgi:transcriptional regulator with XRE-family HTH domain|uniref:Helix-turn-helix domain-containing protein n=1 Tax=Endobacterium cereale TaxID=2663029 RepID=A0A6A8A7B0_9HYPH|nr:helix-turn-helix transcriptional regulator [Endobacterium cereale]MEB2846487.1 helix-turn-helix transcriptional regulator [Endobacterium cereale]MQY45758.1 helix-turn-helix domain-containing protein [Endobacterium cereale]